MNIAKQIMTVQDPVLKTTRKLLVSFLLGLACFAVFGIVVVYLMDTFVYSLDGIPSCVSDSFPQIQGQIANYARSHDGDFPESLETIKPERSRYWICIGSKKPFLYDPKGVDVGTRTVARRHDPNPISRRNLILLCPFESHGWIQQFSWEIVYGQETPNGAVVKVGYNDSFLKALVYRGLSVFEKAGVALP